MSKSFWDELGLEDTILRILDIPPYQETHHFERPFLTSYQIAIELNEAIPDLCDQINKPLGGKGTGEYNSLAQYIGLELSRRIRDDKIPNIEGRHLFHKDITLIRFSSQGTSIDASDLTYYSMYRRTD